MKYNNSRAGNCLGDFFILQMVKCLTVMRTSFLIRPSLQIFRRENLQIFWGF